MNKELELQVINLAKVVFDDAEFMKFMYYLGKGQLNNLRLFIDEKYDVLDALLHLNPNNDVLAQQLHSCDVIENIVMDAYLEKIST